MSFLESFKKAVGLADDASTAEINQAALTELEAAQAEIATLKGNADADIEATTTDVDAKADADVKADEPTQTAFTLEDVTGIVEGAVNAFATSFKAEFEARVKAAEDNSEAANAKATEAAQAAASAKVAAQAAPPAVASEVDASQFETIAKNAEKASRVHKSTGSYASKT